MSSPDLITTLKPRRERAGLSQAALAQRVGVTRQAIIAVEAGRRVPSTRLALQLAGALGCGVDDLFALREPDSIVARLASSPQRSAALPAAGRVMVGRVGERWVAHPVADGAPIAADGLASADDGDGRCHVRPLVDPADLQANVLVAGCAPLLGMVVQRIARRRGDARGTWLPANSGHALHLLEAGLVHLAGLHLWHPGSGQHNHAVIRDRFSAQRMLVVGLTHWRQGLVVAPGNPRGIRDASCLQRSELRFAHREPGSGAATLVERLRGSCPTPPGPQAHDHAQVAQLVRHGLADTGVAIESVALAAGLEFIPLAEERFDLAVPAELAAHAPVRRLVETLDDSAFRREAQRMPGYDVSCCGHVTTLDAA